MASSKCVLPLTSHDIAALHHKRIFRYRLALAVAVLVPIVGLLTYVSVMWLRSALAEDENLQWGQCMNDTNCQRWTDTEELIASTRSRFGNTTAINGVAPPGFAARSTPTNFPGINSGAMLEYVDTSHSVPSLYAVWYNSRPDMARTPIHVHPETQFTCVLHGMLMFIAEGMETKNYSKGECYYMPAMTPMVSVNVGGSPYLDIDVFRVSKGSVPWIIIEDSQLDLQFSQFS